MARKPSKKDIAEAGKAYDSAREMVRQRAQEMRSRLTTEDHPVAYTQHRHTEINHHITLTEMRLIGLSERLAERIANIEKALNETIEHSGKLVSAVHELQKTGVRYVGIFQRAQGYRRGDTVTHDAAMWVALRETQPGETPGIAHDAWQLSEKLWRERR